MDTVKAYPRKQFFVEMLTRDISLEDCILDLIDNSIDSLLRSEDIDIEKAVLGGNSRAQHRSSKRRIDITYSGERFSIEDDCGGIARRHAENDVFCFGPSAGAEPGKLGIYGIGLKRAILKLGQRADVISGRSGNGFRVKIDLDEWLKKDSSIDDWTFPIEDLPDNRQSTGRTAIKVTAIHPEVSQRLRQNTLGSALRRAVAQTYAVFLREYVSIYINGTEVEPEDIPIGSSDEISPGVDSFRKDGVRVLLTVSLAAADRRRQESAGWYVLCNGRVVIRAEKTDLTGWGAGGGLPSFHSKYIGFVGLALFLADHPDRLPWTTTKRGLNRESAVCQEAVGRMSIVAKPVISFLNKLYPSDPAESVSQRTMTENVRGVGDMRELLKKPSSLFKVAQSAAGPRTTRVQYDALVKDIDRIRHHLKKSSMSASAVGLHTFNHYLKTECP